MWGRSPISLRGPGALHHGGALQGVHLNLPRSVHAGFAQYFDPRFQLVGGTWKNIFNYPVASGSTQQIILTTWLTRRGRSRHASPWTAPYLAPLRARAATVRRPSTPTKNVRK